MTRARSVTNPCGIGTGASGAASATTATVASTAAQAALRIGYEGINRGDDALDLAEVRGERAEQRLAGGEHVRVGERGVAAAQAEEVPQDDEEALQRIEHELLERPRGGGRFEEERAQAEQLPARFLLA